MLEKLAEHRGRENRKCLHAHISYHCTEKGEPDVESYIAPEWYHRARYAAVPDGHASPLDFVENRKSISTLYSDVLHSRWGVQEQSVSRLPNDRDMWFHSRGIHLAVATPFLTLCSIQMAS